MLCRRPTFVDEAPRTGSDRDEALGSELRKSARHGDWADVVSLDEHASRRQYVPGLEHVELPSERLRERCDTAILIYGA
jgi:hypothetical protein